MQQLQCTQPLQLERKSECPFPKKREREREIERERDTDQCEKHPLVSSCTRPYWGLDLQPSHEP